MKPADLRRLAAARAQRQAAVLLTRLSDGHQHLLVEDEASLAAPAGDPAFDRSLLEPVRTAALAGRSVTIRHGEADWFVQLHAPGPHLVLVGAVHVAQALLAMSGLLGMKVSVVDPRSGFATAERFPGAALLRQWPDEAFAALRPDRHTAIVTLSHEARIDDPALDAALRSPAFYIGALGSRRTQAARRARLAALGHSATALDRLHGPVGLPIGAIGPDEIALSILAQLVAVRHGAPGLNQGGTEDVART